MRTPIRFLLAATLCTACAAQTPPAPTSRVPRVDVAPTVAAPQPEGRTLPELIEQALPAVVLVINDRLDGTTTYGAGMLVAGGGVLTSDHVVRGARGLRVMLHGRGRTSYTPMDGGLARFLFENDGAMLGARRVSGDETSDLAVLAIDADVSGWPVLEMATTEVRPGDIVLALGHPQETVWSFTQGVVGALHHGAIQHDASVSHGSSGGPLLNARGQVIGINIAKVVSEPGGLAFARPISMASRLAEAGLMGAPALQNPLDRSTPETAAMTCWRAQELGLSELADCFDWEASWTAFEEIAREAGRFDVPPDMRARIEAYLARPGSRAEWIAAGRRSAARLMTRSGHKKAEAPRPAEADLPPEVAKILSDLAAIEEKDRRARPADQAAVVDVSDPQRLQARLRLGIRVEATHPAAPDRAWVLLAGRNPDGSTYRFSELWAKSGAVWLQRWPPLPSDIDQLPSGWAPPIVTYTKFRARKLAHFVRQMAVDPAPPGSLAPPCEETAAPGAVKAKGSGGGASGSAAGRAALKNER